MLMLIMPPRSPGTTSDVQAAPWPNVDTQLHQTRQDSSLNLFLDTMEMEGKIWSGNMIQVLMACLLQCISIIVLYMYICSIELA